MAAPVPEVFDHSDPWTEAEFRKILIPVTLDRAALAAATRPSS